MMDKSTAAYEEAIIRIVTENWRLMKLFMKVISKLDASDANRYINQIRYFQKTIVENLAEVNLKIVNLEGQPYDPGVAATPLNIDEFNDDDVLVIDQMVEPLIMGSDGIKKPGLINLMRMK